MSETNTVPQTDREAEIRNMIIQVMRAAALHLGNHKVVLFGSRATGRAKPRSDFDIGVIGDEPLPVEDFYAIEDQLDALPTLYRIDWVDLNRVGEHFHVSALRVAEVIHG